MTSIRVTFSVASPLDIVLDIEKAHLRETPLDVFSRGLEKKDPVTIQAEGLSLSVLISQFKWSPSGIVQHLRNEKLEKQ